MEKMLDKKSRDFAKNMRDTMIYDKSKNEIQMATNLYVDGKITSSAPSEGGKVYLHNIFISTDRGACLQLYSTSNEPFTIETLAAFMTNNGITSRSKGIALSFESYVERTSSAKTLYTNFVIYALNNTLKLSIEQFNFNFDTNNNAINIGRSEGNYLSVNSIIDTVIEM